MVLFAAIHLISAKGIHEIGKYLNIEKIKPCAVNERRQAERIDGPADQDAVQVAEVGWGHDDRALGGQIPKLIRLPDNLYFVLQGILAAEQGFEAFDPGGVEYSGKAKLHHTSGDF